LKKIGAVLAIFLLVTLFVPKFCYAGDVDIVTTEAVFTDEQPSNTQITKDKVDEVVKDATDAVNNLALTVAEVVSMVSLPIGLLLILWGSVLYFIMGVRNLYKKRQGMLLMWGSATFIVIAKFIHLIVFIVTQII